MTQKIVVMKGEKCPLAGCDVCFRCMLSNWGIFDRNCIATGNISIERPNEEKDDLTPKIGDKCEFFYVLYSRKCEYCNFRAECIRIRQEIIKKQEEELKCRL